MPKLNVQQNNQNVIQAFKNALAIGNLKGIIASDGSHNFSTAGSNRNLLDNPWFTVRQRGAGPFTGTSIHSADRWKSTGGNPTVNLLSPYGIQIVNTTNSNVDQYLSYTKEDLDGKTVTLSVLSDDGITSGTGTFDVSSNSYIITFTFGSGKWYCRFGYFSSVHARPFIRIANVTSNESTSVNIYAIKLELGSVSTLANDAPPELSIARIPCYENHLRLKGQYAPVGYAIALSTTLALLAIPTPVPMRIAPTPSLSGTLYFNAGTPFAITSVQNPTLGVNQVMIQVVGTFDTGKVYLAQFRDANSYLDLSADL